MLKNFVINLGTVGHLLVFFFVCNIRGLLGSLNIIGLFGRVSTLIRANIVFFFYYETVAERTWYFEW